MSGGADAPPLSFDLAPGTVHPMGSRAVLIGARDPEHAVRVARHVAGSSLGAREVTAGLASVLVEAAGRLYIDEVIEVLRGSDDEVDLAPARDHVIEVVLDGEDLYEVTGLLSVSREQIAQELADARLVVASMGFSPGFGYLEGLTGPLSTLGRRATPRARVPAGSLAVAASMAALYPQGTPGGWWLLGRTSATLFDQDRAVPSLLATGDRVTLRVVDELAPSPEHVRRAILPPPGVAGVLRVVNAPPGVRVVDRGRGGLANQGVPRGGPFDPERAHLAALVVGEDERAIEVSGSDFVLRVLGACHVGAIDLDLALDGRPVPTGVALFVGAGQQIEVTSVGRGGRGYLGVGGGPVIEPVLGSMSTDALAGVGPGTLQRGDVIGAMPDPTPLRRRVFAPEDPTHRLRMSPGPHGSALRGGPAVLDGVHAQVSPTSNRVGVRLEAAFGALERVPGEITSTPMMWGAVQLPKDAQPIVLGPDHATHGGYPVVAVLADADRGLLGRLSPGENVTIELISEEEAFRLSERRAAWLRSLVGEDDQS